MSDSEYDYYHFVDEPGAPAHKATPDLATLAAYSDNGTLLGVVEATAA